MSQADKPVIGGVVFSLVGGNVWASWSGAGGSVMLGPCAEVTHMMRDFLAQCELGERLVSRASSND